MACASTVQVISTSLTDRLRTSWCSSGSNGNVPPVAAIGGSNTGLGDTVAVAVDATGTIYALSYKGDISVFAAGSNGNVAPIRTIGGSRTKLNSPEGIAVR